MDENIMDSTLRGLDSLFKNVINQPLRLCIVCNSGMGGSGIVGTSVASELSKHGHDVHLVSYKKPFRLDNKKLKVDVIPVKQYHVLQHFPIVMAAASKMYDIVKKNHIELINVHYAIPYSTASYLAREMFKSEGVKVPIITTVHGTDIHTLGTKKEFKNIVRFALKSSDGITAVSHYLASKIKDKFDIDNEVKVIYNHVDTKKFKKNGNTQLKKRLGGDKKIILHTSNFRTIKRVGDIIDAFRIVNRTVPSRLVLVGDGPERQAMKRKAAKYKMAKDVVFVNPRRDIERFYAVSDLLMFASIREGLGMSILEAMSSSVPVVSTKSGGPQEIIENNKDGYLVGVKDVRSMADKAIDILSNPTKSQRMGRAGRKKVLKEFTADKIIPQYEGYYRKVLLS